MRVKLKVMTGSHEGKEIEVSTEKFLIGRSESCQLRPKSESVSRKHCIIVLRDNRVLIQDLKSRNGTFVNEKRLPSDKAKVLKGGDALRIGKLEFELLIEHGLQAAKKPEVTDVSDAAARTVENGANDSRFEEVDVTSWLDEADQIDRVRKLSDPETRQFRLDEDASSKGDSTELSVGDSEEKGDSKSDSSKASSKKEESAADDDDSKVRAKRKVPDKKAKPGKLPEGARSSLKENSRDAADDALKRFFSGR